MASQNVAYCSRRAQPIPLQVLRQPAAAEADRRGGEGKESGELRERAETPEGTLESASRFDILGSRGN